MSASSANFYTLFIQSFPTHINSLSGETKTHTLKKQLQTKLSTLRYGPNNGIGCVEGTWTRKISLHVLS